MWNADHGKEKTIEAFHQSRKRYFVLCQTNMLSTRTFQCRLGLEQIDCYLIHSPIGGKIVETWDAMIELQEQKLVKSIGVSNFNEHHLQELKKARPDNIPVGKLWI